MSYVHSLSLSLCLSLCYLMKLCPLDLIKIKGAAVILLGVLLAHTA